MIRQWFPVYQHASYGCGTLGNAANADETFPFQVGCDKVAFLESADGVAPAFALPSRDKTELLAVSPISMHPFAYVEVVDAACQSLPALDASYRAVEIFQRNCHLLD